MFAVYFEVEEKDFGFIMSGIAKHMPLLKGFEVQTTNAARGKNRAVKRPHKTHEVILGVLRDNEVHTYAELSEALQKAGLSPNSVSPALSQLAAKNMVDRLDGASAVLKDGAKA